MKKYLLLILPTLILTSCGNTLSPELVDYFNSVSFEKAYESVKNATLTYQGKHFACDENGKLTDSILGDTQITYCLDKSDPENFYSCYEGTFWGTFVTSGQDATGESIENIYSKKFVRFLDPSDNTKYSSLFKVNGAVSSNSSSSEAMLAFVRSFFYSQITDNAIYTGGMYYSDTIYLMRRYSELISLDGNGNMIYSVENQYQTDVDDSKLYTASYDLKVVTDSKGMLATRIATTFALQPTDDTHTAYHRTSKLEESLTVEYNKANIDHITILE